MPHPLQGRSQSAAGIVATITGTRAAKWPTWFNKLYALEPTAFFAARIVPAALADPALANRDWHVSETATDTICRHAATSVAPGGTNILAKRRTFGFKLADTSLGDDVAIDDLVVDESLDEGDPLIGDVHHPAIIYPRGPHLGPARRVVTVQASA